MTRARSFSLTLCVLWLSLTANAVTQPSAPGASWQDLSNASFRVMFDDGGIRSLKRAGDRYDTEYIAPGGTLGRLLIRYRTSPHGDWRQLSDLVPLARNSATRTISYSLATYPPQLAARATASAERGVGGLRALNDGLVPDGVERNAGRGQAALSAAQVPLFTWTAGPNEPGAGGTGQAGSTRWVQYSFAEEEELSRTELFWVNPPLKWRLLYQDGRRWKEITPRGDYRVTAGAFSTIEFAPVRTLSLRVELTMPAEGTVSLAEWRVGPKATLEPSTDLVANQSFTLHDDSLDWTLTLANGGTRPIEVGDLAIPFNFAERVTRPGDIYTRKLLRHALVCGYGSWVYWQRSNGEGPFLVMTPLGDARFEYYDSSGGADGGGVFTPYVHAAAASTAARAAGGNWRLPATSLTLSPKGTPGASATYTFRFQWAQDIRAVRDILYRAAKFDTTIVPGMVVPRDLSILVALRTRNRIASVEAEHPSTTSVEFVGDRGQDTRVYRVRMTRLGENMLTLNYGSRQWSTLEFFVTEPLETLIRKRASFLVKRQQHKDAAKWYLGAYGDWDQKNEILRNPEDRDGLSTWLTDANDDAGNARPAFIASKNVFYPDQDEIRSLELYISKYLWGGMQMTEREKYPYALYGIPNWKVNRSSPDEGRNGQAHVWRIYDYPHIVMLYYRMYQIAKAYPGMVSYLDAAGYLERAYKTAIAYWTVPVAVENWSADAVGTMNEAFLPELIQSLEDEGQEEWAHTLRGYWEGKVERFVNRPPNLYGSEFAFDSTGFESTGAFAKYAMTHVVRPGETLPPGLPPTDFRKRVTYETAREFTRFQLRLNMSDRGWLETTYYQLGSDYRGNLSYLLSYMSQMGGWSILDYGLNLAEDPTDYLRLGYASTLSSWALVNSGTAEGGFGYWFPSAANDGAAGGGFMPEPSGRAWIGKQMMRGAWFYSAEVDVGYCGALRAHATIVARDPVFGEIAYGGMLTREGRSVRVVPRDGLRVRFHVVRDNQRLHMVLDRDGYARNEPIVVFDDLSRIQFTLENRAGNAHPTVLHLAGLPARSYTVSVDGRAVTTVQGTPDAQPVSLPVGASSTAKIEIKGK